MPNEAADDALIGREHACAVLAQAVETARAGRGALWLLSGEAGAGKTRLARHALARSDLPLLEGAARDDLSVPYGPLVTALRSYRRMAAPDPITDTPLAQAINLLTSGLTTEPAHASRAAIFDALQATLAAIAQRQPTAVFLDDLHWADSATLDMLPALSGALAHEPLLIVGAYRDDEIPHGHPIRRLRNELRRGGRLCKIDVGPLDGAQTAQLIDRILGAPPSPALATAVYNRTAGLPFFVEELALALAQSGRLRRSGRELDLDNTTDLPLPESVRDAVRLRTVGLSVEAHQALEIAAVAGLEFDLDLVATLAGREEDGVAELLARGLVVESTPGRATFRHALTRDACYAEAPWLRRRALHRQVAARLETTGAPSALIAEHWLAGREPDRARPALLAAAGIAGRLHAYRDAARLPACAGRVARGCRRGRTPRRDRGPGRMCGTRRSSGRGDTRLARGGRRLAPERGYTASCTGGAPPGRRLRTPRGLGARPGSTRGCRRGLRYRRRLRRGGD